MPISSRVGLTHPESWHKVSERGYLGLFFYRVRKKGSFEVLLVFFSTFSSQNLKYPTLMHWLASWVNPTSKTHIPCLPTTSQVPPVKFSLDSVALNFRPMWWHGPSLKHCAMFVKRPDLHSFEIACFDASWWVGLTRCSSAPASDARFHLTAFCQGLFIVSMMKAE